MSTIHVWDTNTMNSIATFSWASPGTLPLGISGFTRGGEALPDPSKEKPTISIDSRRPQPKTDDGDHWLTSDDCREAVFTYQNCNILFIFVGTRADSVTIVSNSRTGLSKSKWLSDSEIAVI